MNETSFNAEQNEIEYEDAMTEQAATVERLSTELATANAQIVELLEAIDIMAEKLVQEPI